MRATQLLSWKLTDALKPQLSSSVSLTYLNLK